MITKAYSKAGRSCRITFALPPEMVADNGVEVAAVAGDFNDWDTQTHPMKRKKDGSFTAAISAKPGQRLHFRYLLNGERWANDPSADEHVPNPYGAEDSVVVV